MHRNYGLGGSGDVHGHWFGAGAEPGSLNGFNAGAEPGLVANPCIERDQHLISET